ncbi:outer membrane beta-barrel protein [Catenovulum sediminis]|uniref:Outer membrane beta-barrel protein n=1 Tax=Catenovulum sediminis TaxID=1740262 RepID=A0ABV1RKJ5_9ALTE|nr:outer membrane beta-barrel protein [Catenovulum sediminis]
MLNKSRVRTTLYTIALLAICQQCFAASKKLVESQFVTGFSDNVLQNDENVSSQYYIVRGTLNLETQLSQFKLVGSVNGAHQAFRKQNNLELNSVTSNASVKWQPTSQQSVDLNYQASQIDEAPWLGIRRDDVSSDTMEPASFNAYTTQLVYQYQPASERGLVVAAFWNQHKQTYQQQDQVAQNNSKITNLYNGKLGYQWRAGRHIYLSYQNTSLDYPSAFNNNSASDIWAIGLSWQATAITGFDLSLGQEQRQFDNASLNNKNSEYWSVSASWAPKTYSTFKISTQQKQHSSDYLNSILQLDTNYQISWQHTWGNGLQSELSHSQLNSEQLDGQQRIEKRQQTSLNLAYKINRALAFSIDLSTVKNTDSRLRRNFDENKLAVNLQFNFGGRS